MLSRNHFIPCVIVVLVALGGLGAPGYGQNAAQGSKNLHNVKGAGAARDFPTAKDPVALTEEYEVGEADVLRISVWKEPEISQSVVVRPDGKISLPLVNEVKVSGLTPTQIQTLLVVKLKAFLMDPQVTVTIVEIRSKMVYITGEVGKPGAYPVLLPMTVLQLIARAGGLTQFADRKGIYILRDINGNQLRYPFDYRDVIRGRAMQQNIVLRAGDTLVVP